MKPLLLCAALMAVLLYSCARHKANVCQVADVALAPVPNAETNHKDAALLKQADAGAMSADTAVAADSAAAPPPRVLQSGTPAASPDWDKKIIKTANITLELKDYAAYNNSIHARVKMYGAYIAQEQQSETDNQLTNEVTIKVPVDKFEDLVNSLGGEGIKVMQKNISSEDVTGEVVDTKARLEAKKQVRDRYLDLLKQAKTMKDILDVQAEINSIQEDIESAAGRVDYLVHSAAYSTVNIKYYQFLNGVTEKDIEPAFLSKITDAFKTGGEIITNIVLFFVSIWPLCAAGAFLFFYFRKSRGKKAKEAIAE
jgi:hypothetical protein